MTTNGFKLIKDWSCLQLSKAVGCASLWAYFLLAVVLFGCIGIWIAVGHRFYPGFLLRNELLLAILAAAWAISGASCADFLFGDRENFVRSIPIFSAILLLVTSFASIFIFEYFFAMLSFLIASILWFLANAEKLKDVNNPLASVGGDANLKPSGDNGGFKV